MRVFVDTNVLLDMICQREGFKEDADTIFRYLSSSYKCNFLVQD